MNVVSVIIPMYNAQKQLPGYLNYILQEKTKSIIIEFLLIDDGSTDGSDEICRKYADRYPTIRYFHQENKGVSAARNLGIQNATGKYIFFLDADDRLAPGTIEQVSAFFDEVYDQTDLVTYPIETIFNGKKLKPHFRYQFLKESGIYDLRECPYIGQTTMNIVVKNQFENNILFDEKQTYSEDQKYCCDVLKEKLQMGFCKEGKYLYYRSRNTASGRLAGSCYIFEQCMSFFEDLFGEFSDVPATFQGLYVNDLYWKMCSNILFPYHYAEVEYQLAMERIQSLLGKCDTSIILNHPAMDFFEKYYLLRLKDEKVLQWKVNREGFSLWNQNQLTLQEKSMEMVITKVRVTDGRVEIEGFLKTVFFQFYKEKPTLCVVENHGRLTRKLELFPSTHNYYQSHEPTQRFWAMKYQCDVKEVQQFHFEVEVGNYWFPVHYYFMPLTPFSHQYKRYTYQKDAISLKIEENNEFRITKSERFQYRRIWLYYDCKGVTKDNGMLQFEHDIEQDDGVKRYYIITDKRQALNPLVKAHGVLFGSRRHQRLFLKAEKIITAYIEENNILPFAVSDYDRYAGQFQFETIYLQHGVLHIEMPWKYSPEKIMADKVVVSTEQEAKLFQKNGFRDIDLWKVKMPRFDFLSQTTIRGKKILFAPSWRSYLVGNCVDNRWELLEEKFQASTYYKKMQNFLDSDELVRMLKEHQYILDVKLHPIFRSYKEYFHGNSEYIHFVNQVDEGDYSLFITDFSSFLYNFLYMGIPVLTFIPDIMEFKAGLNGYRNLNYSKEFWSHAATEPEEIIDKINDFFDNKKIPGFEADFFSVDDARKEIYKRLIEGT